MVRRMTGTWHFVTDDKPMLHLTTSIPMTLVVKAPITSGSLSITTGVDFFLELALLKLEAGNFAAKFGVGSARDLIKKNGGDSLSFEAKAVGDTGPWELAGMAQAGTLEIPTKVTATPSLGMDELHIGGSITMDDIELPLPGMSGLSSITFTLDGKVRLMPS
jgi:hypothetical protein